MSAETDTPPAEHTPPEPPEELGAAGRDLWTRVVADLEFQEHEAAVLRQACATVDTIADLAAALEGAELIVPGSKGQPTLSPLVSELRLQRALVASLLLKLSWPQAEGEGEDEWSGLSTSARARKANHIRWANRGRR